MTKQPEHDTGAIPQLHLEQAALGERALGPAADAPIVELQRDNAAILRAHPPHLVAAEVRRRHQGQQARAPWFVAPVFAAAAALVLVAWPSPTRTKGLTPHVVVHTQSGVLHDGASVRAGAALQLGIVAAHRPHAVLLSLDGRGEVTQHFPEPGQSTQVGTQKERLLNFTYVLDDAPNFERFYLVTGDRPLDVDELKRKLRAGRLVGDDVVTLELRKAR